MPWTVSHAAAVLPLRRWCPHRLSFVGLVIGSMSPDFGYYLGLTALADFAHSAPGVIAIGLPAGLLLAAAIRLLRGLLAAPLPQPHRHALQAALASLARDLNPRGFAVLGASVVIGAATHAGWDSFTHAGSLPVTHIEWLQWDLLQIGTWTVETYSVLQHASTLLGIVVLAIAYRSWLRSGVAAGAPSPDARHRARWWSLIAIAGLGAAVCAGWITAGAMAGHAQVPALVVDAVLVASNVIVLAYFAAALAWSRADSAGGGRDRAS